MGERKIDSFEFGSNLENEAARLHRIFSAVIKDDSSLQAQMPTSGIPGQQITVEITSGDGKYSQTSAMVTDGTGAVVAYGKIGDPGIGLKTFTIPGDIPFGEYNLIVFGEQVNRARSID